MFGSYLKMVWRTLLRRRGLAFVSVGGLALGMACSLLLLLYVRYELSFDRCMPHAESIYRILLERKGGQGTGIAVATPPPLGPALVSEIPGVVRAVRFMHTDNPVPVLRSGEVRFYEPHFLFADPEALDLFGFVFVAGDRSSALLRPNTVILTEASARRYFGRENPLGQTLRWNDQLSLEVTGVVRGLPSTSSLECDLLASFSTIPVWLGKEFVESWSNMSCETYIELSPGTTMEQVAGRLTVFRAQKGVLAVNVERILLQRLDRIHLYSWQDFGLTGGGDIREVALFAVIALLILIIVSVSFFGLTTARLAVRAREVGVRQALGAGRGSLFAQFMGEAMLLSLLALLGAGMLVEIALPAFSAVTGRNLASLYAGSYMWWLAPAAAVLLVAVLSGASPALTLSRLSAVQALSGRLGVGKSRLRFWKVLVVIQCTLAVALLLGAWTVHEQLRFLQNKHLGLDKDRVLIISFRDQQTRLNPEPLKNRLLGLPGVERVASVALLPGGPVATVRVQSEGKIESFSDLWVGRDFLSTIGAERIAGRDFGPAHEPADAVELILNETAARHLGWQNPEQALGRTLELAGSGKGTVIGVVSDFHYLSLQHAVGPLLIRLWPWPNYMLVRLTGSPSASILDNLRKVWEEVEPGTPFSYQVLGENFERHYQDDFRLARLLDLFTLLAAFIATIGLVGLIGFITERRMKEIGVRRVFGASVARILGSLALEVLALVLLADLIAVPLAWLCSRAWLGGFALHQGLGLSSFVLATAVSMLAAFIAVLYRAGRSAAVNPVDVLREPG